MPEGSYTFTERRYHNLAKAGVNPLAVTDVLSGGVVVRRHIGADEIAAIGRMRGEQR